MIVVDIEATGLDPFRHSIISIGALDFNDPENQFYGECRMWDGSAIDQESLGVIGLSEAEVSDPNKKSLEELIKDFIAWMKAIDERTLAGGNPSFDRDFLSESAKRYNIDWKFGYRLVDLHSLGFAHHLRRGLEPPKKEGRTHLSVDRILNYTGLPSEPKPHNGLVGAKMEAEAFSRLIYGKSLLKEYAHFPVSDYLK